MEFERQISVQAPADNIWKILATDFNEVSEWASFVLASRQNPDVPAGRGRVCDVAGMGETHETLYELDDRQRRLGFTLESEKNPFFMREIKNTWRVEPQGENQAVVHVGVQIGLALVFKQLLSSRMEKMMTKRADVMLAELKHFAETGQPSPA